MTEEIDYQAIAAQLQRELETARLTIVKMRHARSPFERVNVESIKGFVEKHYMVILIALMVVSILTSFIKIHLTFSVQRSNPNEIS